jgi:hypothetical protein
MRLSLRKAALVALSTAAQQEIRVRFGRDDKSYLVLDRARVFDSPRLRDFSTTQINVCVSHISQETSEIPGFPVRGSIRDRVCGFHLRKAA